MYRLGLLFSQQLFMRIKSWKTTAKHCVNVWYTSKQASDRLGYTPENQYLKRLIPPKLLDMIPRDKAVQLTAIYLYICNLHDQKIQTVCERFSNNNRPEFTDQELITIYLFVMHSEQQCDVYRNDKNWLLRDSSSDY